MRHRRMAVARMVKLLGSIITASVRPRKETRMALQVRGALKV
jgi:hypothetical protein